MYHLPYAEHLHACRLYYDRLNLLPHGLYPGKEEILCVYFSAHFTRSLIDERITNPSATGSLLRNSPITCLSFVLSSFRSTPSEHSYVKLSMAFKVILAICASFFSSLALFCVHACQYIDVCNTACYMYVYMYMYSNLLRMSY